MSAHPSRWQTRRPWLVGAVAGLMLLGAAIPAIATLSRSSFQLEGNVLAADAEGVRWYKSGNRYVSQAVAVDGTRDWDTLFDEDGERTASIEDVRASFINDWNTETAAFPADDTTFTVGSKDILDVPEWTCTPANNVNNKTDIINAYSAVDDGILYFGMEKDTDNGDNNVGLWFFKDGRVGCEKGAFQGAHTDGDLLIVASFTRGGGVGTVRAYIWDDGALVHYVDGMDCLVAVQTGADPDLCAATNGEDVTVPWATVQSGEPTATKARATLFEGAIDIRSLFPDTCYASFLFNTRSSQELTATLFDYAGGVLDTCPRLTVSQDVATSFTRTYPWTITKTADPVSADAFMGETVEVEYTIEADRGTGVDSAWEAEGTVLIENDEDRSATVAEDGVVVTVDGTAVAVTCSETLPFRVDPGEDLTCTWSAALPDGDDVAVVATVTQANGIEDEADEDVAFTEPTTEVDASIDVDDVVDAADLGDGDDAGDGDFTAAGDDETSYTSTYACTDDLTYTDGSAVRTIDNTATAVGDEVDASDSASVEITCWQLGLDADAAGTYGEEYDWTIDKDVSLDGGDTWLDDAELELAPNQPYEVYYRVVATKGASPSLGGIEIAGTITIANPAPVAATVASLDASLSIAGAVTTDCTFPLTVPAEDEVECAFTAEAETVTAQTLSVTLDQDLAGTDDEATYPVGGPLTRTANFGEAEVTYDGCITVADDLYTIPGTLSVCATTTWTYPDPAGAGIDVGSDTCGEYDVTNTASYAADEPSTGETGEDAVTVHVAIECLPGCTLTQGYWKTHSEYGPARYDETWGYLDAPSLGEMGWGPDGSRDGADEPFFAPRTTLTWYQAFGVPPKGNAYWQLAHQYMAAQLNVLTGAFVPDAVGDALEEATGLFESAGPSNAGWTSKSRDSLRSAAIRLAGVLGSYNTGSTGPGHCDEDETSAR